MRAQSARAEHCLHRPPYSIVDEAWSRTTAKMNKACPHFHCNYAVCLQNQRYEGACNLFCFHRSWRPALQQTISACSDPANPVLMTLPVDCYNAFKSICQCESGRRSYGVNFYGMLCDTAFRGKHDYRRPLDDISQCAIIVKLMSIIRHAGSVRRVLAICSRLEQGVRSDSSEQVISFRQKEALQKLTRVYEHLGKPISHPIPSKHHNLETSSAK